MGCASSKQIEAAVDVYRPPPSSFAVFDINAVQEPWIMVDDTQEQHDGKTQHVPDPILEKLNKLESDGPQSWDEVSKALEDLKPTLNNPTPPTPNPDPVSSPVNVNAPAQDSAVVDKQLSQGPRKNISFRTLEELDTKLTSKPTELKKSESARTDFRKNDRVKTELRKTHSVNPESRTGSAPVAAVESGGIKPVRENIFVLKDRLEREKEGKGPPVKWDPLRDYPEKCPPGGADTVVLYTTSLGGVRRTYEDSNRVRSILESHRVVFDERDVALHGGFLSELRELLAGEETVRVPRLFVKGRYVGGVEEVVGLNETGRLGRLMSWARVERGVVGCGGCGGARFVPCLECGGSCKVVVGDRKEKERCPECNENGLMLCPACH